MLDAAGTTDTTVSKKTKRHPSNSELENGLRNLLFALDSGNQIMIRKHLKNVHEITGSMLDIDE